MTVFRHLYLHIPFCRRRCAYCDFNTYANREDRIAAYVQALCRELAMLAAAPPAAARPAGHSLRPTVFFGGGTPSMLTPGQLEAILQAAEGVVPLEGAEITLEANPGAVLGSDTDALGYLRDVRALGINRLSLGVQSLHDPSLRVLGRTHTAAEAYQCFETARRAGFDNINLDFMFGLPGQTPQQWAAALDTIGTWGAEHFSLYSLILEESTPLYAQVVGGRVVLPEEDDTAAMYELAMQRFAAAGYAMYEISNWARSLPGESPDAQPALACQHNLAYWFNNDYLAAGAGAHGHVYPQRYANLLGIDAYIAQVQRGDRPLAETTALTPHDLRAETMFMGLRLNAGVRRAHFRQCCGLELEEAFGGVLADLEQQGLLQQDAQGVRLTARGRMLGNQVFAHFVG